ncbi:MAG: VIT domain-containing protein, partial [Bacteroidota bacterium]
MNKLLLSWGLLVLPFALLAQTDQTASPYFYVSGADSNEQALPLRHTEAEVNITAEIADVTITQVYQNTGQKPLEAVYVFPASTRAAVYGMTMQVGERIIEAKIKEKAQAQKIYEKAKEAGKTASLLEQHRANVFQMNVANILPGDSVVVKLSYTEFIESEWGVYEFVFPTVVGPRYVSPSETDGPIASQGSSPSYAQQPYHPEGEGATFTFDLQGQIAGGGPVSGLRSKSHDLLIETDSLGRAQFKVDPRKGFAANRDIILAYELRGPEIEAGLMTYREKGEKFFLLNIQPPTRVVVNKEDLAPREYVFIMDVSGSMSGFPMMVSKALMRDLLKDLNQQDRFNILQFAGNSHMLSEKSLRVTPQNIQRGLQFVGQPGGSGGTELMAALQRALDLPGTKNFTRTFVICTDGYVTVDDQAMDLIRSKRDEMNFFAFGIGSSVNRLIIEGMARASGGEPVVVTKPVGAKRAAKAFRQQIESPVLVNVEVDFGEMEVYDVEPQMYPNLYRSSPISIFGKYRGKLDGELVLKGENAAGDFEQVISLEGQEPDDRYRALRYLWARERLRQVQDYRLYPMDEEERKEEAIELGLQYNLLTNYTSFVAVDQASRNPGIENETVPTPLPLPQGVSNQAIAVRGSRTGSTNYYVDGVSATSAGYSYSNGQMSFDEVVVVG